MALSAVPSARKPRLKFSVPGMLLTLVVAVAGGVLAGLAANLISWLIPCGIPDLLPVFVGVAVGLITGGVGRARGRCRSQTLAIAVAVVAAVIGWGSRHAVDYARFRWDVYRGIAAEAQGADSASINSFIDEWLQDEAGQPGFIGFVLLEARSQEVEFYQGTGGAVIGTFRLTGPLLLLYWIVELIIAGGVAGFAGSKVVSGPFCDRCGAPRSTKVIVPGSVEHLDEAIEALGRQDMRAAVTALGVHEQGDVARLELEFCPACHDNIASLVLAGDAGERVVCSQRLDPGSARELLALAR